MYVVYKKRSALVVLTSSLATIVLSAFLPRHDTTASRSLWLPTWRADCSVSGQYPTDLQSFSWVSAVTLHWRSSTPMSLPLTPQPGHAIWLLRCFGLYPYSIFFQRSHLNRWDFNSKLGNKLTDDLSMGEHSCGPVLVGLLETHGLLACNTAFQHATRHMTTWQGQYRDATNGNIVPIYNTIDFAICRQSHKSLPTN